MRKNKLFCILASMTMLVGAGVFVAHNHNVDEVAAAETTEQGLYSAMTTSEDGKTRTWDFSKRDSSVSSSVNLASGTSDNGIIFINNNSKNTKSHGSGYLSHKPETSMYIPVPNGSAGTITFCDNGSNSGRYTTLYVNNTATTKKINQVKTAKGGDSIEFTSAEISTYNSESYLYFVNNGSGEMKTETIQITLTTKTFVESGEKIDPLDVTFNHNYDGSTDYTSKTDDYGYVTSYTPTRDGYNFVGWYTEADCVNEFDFSKTISTATTLYAKWDRIFTIEGNGNIVVDGNIADITGLTLTLSNSSNTYTSKITDAIYNFGDVKNGEYTLSINDTSGLVAITSSTTITISEDTDVIGDIAIKASEKMSKTHTWDLTKGLVKGDNGNGLFAGEDMPLQTDGYAQGSTNPKLDNDKITPISGAYLTLYVSKAGIVRIDTHFTGTKTTYVVSEGVKLYSHEGAGIEDYLFEFEVEANKTYYVYASGSKVMINSISYTEEIANPTATVYYQYDNDENPTAVRFISELVCDPDYIDTIQYSFTKDGVPAKNEVKIYTVYSSIADQAEFTQKDNTWYAVLSLTGYVSEYEGSELVVTLNVTFRNDTAPITVSRTLTLGQ